MDLTRIDAIDALLPQTQCGKCGHPGCRPYAEGIAAGEAINRCPPGGQQTVVQLAALLGVAALPLATPPQPAQVAVIREAECIGCTKCLQACPVDAIVGAAKRMHTVIRAECSGCELCLAPCPVDCIDLLPLPADEAPLQRQRAAQFRRRHAQRLARRAAGAARRGAERPASPRHAGPGEAPDMPTQAAYKRLKIEAAQLRMALSRTQKQLALHGTAALQAQLDSLRAASQAIEARLRAADARGDGAEPAQQRPLQALAEPAERHPHACTEGGR